jgi:hypothetical protein
MTFLIIGHVTHSRSQDELQKPPKVVLVPAFLNSTGIEYGAYLKVDSGRSHDNLYGFSTLKSLLHLDLRGDTQVYGCSDVSP